MGDELYGTAFILNGGSGAYAELAAVNDVNSSKKPISLSFEEAAALPLAGVSAIQALEEHMKLQKGQKILIHRGAGGIGHLAIQLAKMLGAYVVTTVSTRDIAYVKSLGADEVVDYKTQKFEKLVKDCDGVFDTVGGDVTNTSFQALKSGGILVTMSGVPDMDMAKSFGVSVVRQGTEVNTKHLIRLTDFVNSGKIKVHVDKTFPLANAKEAFDYQEKQSPIGKVVLKIK